MLQMAPYPASYNFFNDPTSPLPGPTDLAHSFAMTSALVSGFAAIGLNYDATHNMAGTMSIYPNTRPIWIVQPVVDAQSHSINVSLTTSTTGNLYAELVKDDAEVLPSSRQVTMLVDGFGTPAEISYSQPVNAMEAVSFSIEGLQPASSYVMLISAKNNDPRLPRIMRDDIMSKIEVITKAATGVITEDYDDFGLWIVAAIGLLLV